MTCFATLHERFTQTDPTPYGAGSPAESAYAYVGNNPAVYTDLSGMRRELSLALSTKKGPKAPNPSCDQCDLRISSAPSFDSDLGTWGSKPATNADRKLHAKWRGKAAGSAFSDGLLGGGIRDLPFAGFMSNMYLSNQGGDVVWDGGPANRIQNRAWNSLLSELEELQYTQQDFANVILDSAAAGSGKWESSWVSAKASKTAQMNVYYGMNKFQARVVANRSPSGKWCRKLYVADRYNFDPKNSSWDSDMFQLFEAGLAKPFNFYAGIPLN